MILQIEGCRIGGDTNDFRGVNPEHSGGNCRSAVC